LVLNHLLALNPGLVSPPVADGVSPLPFTPLNPTLSLFIPPYTTLYHYIPVCTTPYHLKPLDAPICHLRTNTAVSFSANHAVLGSAETSKLATSVAVRVDTSKSPSKLSL